MKPIAWIDPNDNMSDPFSWNKTSYHTVPLYTAPQCDGCGNCHTCLVGVMENNMPVTSQRMIVCSDCGNKRCPKASNHRHKCTGSNEVGQYGSIYTAPRELSDEEIIEIGNAVTNLIDSNEGWIEFARAILKKASEK
jgi:hypothetical protein